MENNKDMELIKRKAQVLIDALPYLRDFNSKIIVITYLCNNQLNGEEEQTLMKDISTLHSVGMLPVIVHDTRMGADIFRENKRLAKLIEFTGTKAVGICGIDEQTLRMTISNGYIPVVTPYDIDTEHMGIDTIQSAKNIATLLQAEKLIFLGKHAGLEDDNGEHLYHLSEEGIKSYMKTHVMDKQLHNMLKNAIEALDGGVNRVHIIEGKVEHAVLLELFSMKGIGTVFTDDNRRLYPHEQKRRDSQKAAENKK